MSDITYRAGSEFTPTETVLDFLGAEHCKLLYRLRRKTGLKEHRDRAAERAKGSSLFILVYQRGSTYPSVIEYPDDDQYKSFNPLISPDGTAVLYNQSFRATDMFILKIGDETPKQIGFGANPHWYYDQETNKKYVVFRAENAMYDDVPQPGKTFLQEIDAEFNPVSEPEQIANNGYGGGISADGRFLVTAFKLPCILDRKTGRFSAPWGTVLHQPDHTNQCCCPSIAPDNSGRFMVLRWPHNRFSISDFTGNTRIHFEKPRDYLEWQTPEWSTDIDFCTAAAMNDQMIYDLFMVRIADQQHLQITSDGGYVHGHLWVQR